MPAINSTRCEELSRDFLKVLDVLTSCPEIEKSLAVPPQEFKRRQVATFQALEQADLDVGFVFSDEHYDGDVPYLGGNTNITIEQGAGVLGKDGFHIIAGLEGGYVSEQLAARADAKVHKVELLQLADEKYPIRAERIEDVLEQAAGRKVRRIGLLTPRQVIPCGIVDFLEHIAGRENVVDAQELYQRIRYEKSDIEMALIRDAARIGDAMLRCMLAVIRPGLLETQVAGWAYWAAKELGSEENGWDVMVTSGEANRTLIGKALNRPIREGEYLHLGVAPKRDGLNACVRRSLVVVDGPSQIPSEQQYWFDFIEEAYQVGEAAYRRVALEGLPAQVQEQALIDFFSAHSSEVSKRYGKSIQLETLKPYTGTHNSGYTECQEFFGAITLDSSDPLGNQIVTMLDVALRGIGDHWNDVILPDLDYIVIENTLGKFGPRVENFNCLPLNVQALVGKGF
ncbi:MAG TPA: M24 family metallopeptidase [Anaerolineales bacterium]|nr:M24 family metallopeptidase [Anaerolineales bacterium]